MKKLIFILLSLLISGTMLINFTACEDSYDGSSFEDEDDDEEDEEDDNKDNDEEDDDIQQNEVFDSKETNTPSDNNDNDKQQNDEIDDLKQPSVGLEYKLNADENAYIVTGIGTCKDTEVIIPEEYDGLPIIGIGEDAFEKCEQLTGITIPDSFIYIHDYAFSMCINLTSITIPNGVTYIGWYAFSGCESLKSVTIPYSVEEIGYGVFEYCTGLEHITVAPENPNYHSNGECLIETQTKTLIAGCKNSVIPSDGSVTTIGDSAFEDCINLKVITIPYSVTVIGDEAFHGCTGLESIVIPYSVTTIGDEAFNSCTNLKSLRISYGVTDIGAYAFSNCISLESVTIPDGVTTIGNNAFDGCTSLKRIDCEVELQPINWNGNWIGTNNAIVYWAGVNRDEQIAPLFKTLMDNIEQWGLVSDEFSQKYTYDDVSARSAALYTAGTLGEYYFVVYYSIKTGYNEITMYNRIYYVNSDGEFYYWTNDGTALANYRYFSTNGLLSGEEIDSAAVRALIDTTLLEEKKYFDEIYLYPDEIIELTDQEEKLFNNMYSAIIELEYYTYNREELPLLSFEYYYLGNGKCEAVLFHGTRVTPTSATGYTTGYRIDDFGYSQLSNSEKEKVQNTTNTIKVEWNVEWSMDKKQYMLKKAIATATTTTEVSD